MAQPEIERERERVRARDTPRETEWTCHAMSVV